MSFVQRLVRRFVSAETFARMEADSRLWHVICDGCGAAHNIWDLGGIRYRASGRPKTFGRCKSCGERHVMSIRKLDSPH